MELHQTGSDATMPRRKISCGNRRTKGGIFAPLILGGLGPTGPFFKDMLLSKTRSSNRKLKGRTEEGDGIDAQVPR